LRDLVACIDAGISTVESSLKQVKVYVEDLRLVYSTLDPETGSRRERRRDFNEILAVFREGGTGIYTHMAKVMASFAPGLFVTCNDSTLPRDNLDLERWFRRPKGHERRVHGHAHAGIRLVREGPTLMMVLDAHGRHPAPFTANDLLPYYNAVPPACQVEAEARHAIMRRASSRTLRSALLAKFEQRYRKILDS
jgi:hypothetical protein